MKKLLTLLLLSLGFIGNSYAETRTLEDWVCKEGFTKSENGKFCISDNGNSIGALTVNVEDEYKVEVFKKEKHIFTFNCRHHIICYIFSTSDKVSMIYDGEIPEVEDLLPLTLENVKKTYDGKLRFFVILRNAPATKGKFIQYAIDIATGGIDEEIYEWNRYQNGMPKPSGDELCVNMFLC